MSQGEFGGDFSREDGEGHATSGVDASTCEVEARVASGAVGVSSEGGLGGVGGYAVEAAGVA